VTSSPRVQALRLALAETYPDSNSACNELLVEIGPGRAGLTQVLLEMAGLLDEAAGEQWIRAALAAELDAQDPHAP
jgi:hypothetical protein